MLLLMLLTTELCVSGINLPNILLTLASSRGGLFDLLDWNNIPSPTSCFWNNMSRRFRAHLWGSLGGALAFIRLMPLCHWKKFNMSILQKEISCFYYLDKVHVIIHVSAYVHFFLINNSVVYRCIIRLWSCNILWHFKFLLALSPLPWPQSLFYTDHWHN